MAASTRSITPTHTGPFPRGTTPTNSHPAPQYGTHLSNSPRGLSPRHSPQPLTGAAAIADERRREQEKSRQTSPNPAAAVIQNLLGQQPGISRAKDAPPEPAQMSAPVAKMAKSIVIPEQVTHDGNMQTSPVSLSSFGSADLTTAQTATATEATAGPVPTGAAPAAPEGANASQQQQQSQPPPPQTQHHHQPIAPNPGDAPSNRAFTFPGPLPPEHDPRAPSRQMSLPNSGYNQNTPKSPSAKRHKCPYCSTDFTRHHNLKSHLLTHSQEKPYECPTCQARFRRLHDLKRHTKLHTGERPHTCDKCGRRFARGDALARHNKGQGGCAGRRSSFGIDDDLGDKDPDAMDGVTYHDGRDGEGEEDEDGAGRRISEPARKRQNTGTSTQAASSLSSIHYNSNQSGVFGQSGMTESPKPISPGQTDHHRLSLADGSLPGARSPNMGQQLHQQNFARGAGRGSSPMGLPPPHGSNGPHLPSLPGLNPMGVPSKGSQGGKGGSLLQHTGTGSNPGSTSSHGASSGGSMREIIGGRGDVDMWQYVRELEARQARRDEDNEARISKLQDEVRELRGMCYSMQMQMPPHCQQQQIPDGYLPAYSQPPSEGNYHDSHTYYQI